MSQLSVGDKVSIIDTSESAEVTVSISSVFGFDTYKADYGGRTYRMMIVSNPYDQQMFDAKYLISILKNSSLTERITRPAHIVITESGDPGFLTEPIPEGFSTFREFMNTYKHVKRKDGPGYEKVPVRFTSMEKLIQCAINYTKTIEQINEAGYVIEFLDPDKMMLNCETGDVIYDSPADLCPMDDRFFIKTAREFLAPEVIRGQKPDEHSQLHWLAVGLFELLMHNHPLTGSNVYEKVCLTPSVEFEVYGRHPVFIFDPDDDSNRPMEIPNSNAIKNWPQYPEYLRDAFTRVFTAGLSEPEKRLTYSEWTDVLTKLLRDFS